MIVGEESKVASALSILFSHSAWARSEPSEMPRLPQPSGENPLTFKRRTRSFWLNLAASRQSLISKRGMTACCGKGVGSSSQEYGITSCNLTKYFSPSSRRQNSRSGCIQKSANHIFSSRYGLMGGVMVIRPSAFAHKVFSILGIFGRSNNSKKRY